MLVAWIGGIVTSFSIRDEYEALREIAGGEGPTWPAPTQASREWSLRYALAAFFVTFGGTVLLGVLLRYGLGIHVRVGVGIFIVDAILLAALIPLARRHHASPRDLGLRPTVPVASIGLGVLLLVAYFVLAGAYSALFVGHTARDAANLLAQARHLDTLQTIITILATCLSAPIVSRRQVFDHQTRTDRRNS